MSVVIVVGCTDIFVVDCVQCLADEIGDRLMNVDVYGIYYHYFLYC